jgi:uncharacterized protein YjbI with pentapeptide repeats
MATPPIEHAVNVYFNRTPEGGLGRVLDVLAGAGATRVGSTEIARTPIDVVRGFRALIDHAQDLYILGIGSWSIHVDTVGIVSINATTKVESLESGQRVGEQLFDALVSLGSVDFAVCHAVEQGLGEKEARLATIICRLSGVLYADEGPASVGYRTIIGPRVLKLLAKPELASLRSAGVAQTDGSLRLIARDRAEWQRLDALFRASGVTRGAGQAGWQPLDEYSEPKPLSGDGGDAIHQLQGARRADGEPPVTDLSVPKIVAPFANIGGTHADNIDFEGGVLAWANLRAVSFVDAGFVTADLRGIDARNARFEDSSFDHADLRWASLRDAELPISRFDGANCAYADLTGARGPESAEGACFDDTVADRWAAHGCHMPKATFRRASLRGAEFERANLEGACFDGADLTNASFRGANLRRATFDGAKLDGAIFDGSVRGN